MLLSSHHLKTASEEGNWYRLTGGCHLPCVYSPGDRSTLQYLYRIWCWETVLSGFDGQFQRFPAPGSRGNKERGSGSSRYGSGAWKVGQNHKNHFGRERENQWEIVRGCSWNLSLEAEAIFSGEPVSSLNTSKASSQFWNVTKKLNWCLNGWRTTLIYPNINIYNIYKTSTLMYPVSDNSFYSRLWAFPFFRLFRHEEQKIKNKNKKREHSSSKNSSQ